MAGLLQLQLSASIDLETHVALLILSVYVFHFYGLDWEVHILNREINKGNLAIAAVL